MLRDSVQGGQKCPGPAEPCAPPLPSFTTAGAQRREPHIPGAAPDAAGSLFSELHSVTEAGCSGLGAALGFANLSPLESEHLGWDKKQGHCHT